MNRKLSKVLKYKVISTLLCACTLSLGYTSSASAAALYNFEGNITRLSYYVGDTRTINPDPGPANDLGLIEGGAIDLSVYIDFDIAGQAHNPDGTVQYLNDEVTVDGYATSNLDYFYADITSASFDYSTYSHDPSSNQYLPYSTYNYGLISEQSHVFGSYSLQSSLSLASLVTLSSDFCSSGFDCVPISAYDWEAGSSLRMTYVFHDSLGNKTLAVADLTLASIAPAPVPIPSPFLLLMSGMFVLFKAGRRLD